MAEARSEYLVLSKSIFVHVASTDLVLDRSILVDGTSINDSTQY